MSTKGPRNYRPIAHFSPSRGWINDPNGLIFAGGQWHLFAQHNPQDTVWGPMHWLHAVSDDLLVWKELGIALSPDAELGMIYSGSAALDEGNTSGLGSGSAPMLLMFTHHGKTEQQSIAFSDDYRFFTKYAGNPVIPNPGIADFRDPRLIHNLVRGGWTAVVAAGDHIDFFASRDALHWEKTGEFGKTENRLGGVFECPDLFRMKTPDGRELWVLTASLSRSLELGGNRMAYFLGEFNGNAFCETALSGQTLVYDEGFDDYAAITFAGAGETLSMGWATHWHYAKMLPTGVFCGQTTYARRLYLADTRAGLRMAARPVAPVFSCSTAFSSKNAVSITSELFHLRVRFTGAFDARLYNDSGSLFRFGLRADGAFYTDRTAPGNARVHPDFDSGCFARTETQRLSEGSGEYDLYFDTYIAEMFSDGGVYANTTLVFPEKPFTAMAVEGNAELLLEY